MPTVISASAPARNGTTSSAIQERNFFASDSRCGATCAGSSTTYASTCRTNAPTIAFAFSQAADQLPLIRLTISSMALLTMVLMLSHVVLMNCQSAPRMPITSSPAARQKATSAPVIVSATVRTAFHTLTAASCTIGQMPDHQSANACTSDWMNSQVFESAPATACAAAPSSGYLAVRSSQFFTNQITPAAAAAMAAPIAMIGAVAAITETAAEPAATASAANAATSAPPMATATPPQISLCSPTKLMTRSNTGASRLAISAASACTAGSTRLANTSAICWSLGSRSSRKAVISAAASGPRLAVNPAMWPISPPTAAVAAADQAANLSEERKPERCTAPRESRSKNGLKAVPTAMLRLSLIVDIAPAKVWDCLAIMPPKRWFMPAVIASMAVAELIAPFSAIFIAVGTSTPMASASICQAGMPASVSCSISSALTLPLACI
ncbi:MAG: hypothetical protein POELPBGB_03978 [Bacteroidia bacterium]|nr:hypothetical protein [Bacteroidia bacterium]